MSVWTLAVACSADTFPAVGNSPMTSRFGSLRASATANAVSMPGSATRSTFRGMMFRPCRVSGDARRRAGARCEGKAPRAHVTRPPEAKEPAKSAELAVLAARRELWMLGARRRAGDGCLVGENRGASQRAESEAVRCSLLPLDLG